MGTGSWYHRGRCRADAYGRRPKTGWCVKLRSKTAGMESLAAANTTTA